MERYVKDGHVVVILLLGTHKFFNSDEPLTSGRLISYTAEANHKQAVYILGV